MEFEVLIACPDREMQKTHRIYVLNSDGVWVGNRDLGATIVEGMVATMNMDESPRRVWSAKRREPKNKFWRTPAFIGCTGTEKPENETVMVGVKMEEKNQEVAPSQKPEEPAFKKRVVYMVTCDKGVLQDKSGKSL